MKVLELLGWAGPCAVSMVVLAYLRFGYEIWEKRRSPSGLSKGESPASGRADNDDEPPAQGA